ncbi:hypothetical protein ACVII1_007714 [Bradyrhizobium elkanii]|uniref:hypothetical protein n=1 Tax=Bradyrhizobium TaxID=374 RepID=UPI002712093B|nr:hypothetical protein [Bradyrhizobium elkanii]WLA38877.1 hypothetical protein QNJ95_39210 [Bradyrhizobium elkanii]
MQRDDGCDIEVESLIVPLDLNLQRILRGPKFDGVCRRLQRSSRPILICGEQLRLGYRRAMDGFSNHLIGGLLAAAILWDRIDFLDKLGFDAMPLDGWDRHGLNSLSILSNGGRTAAVEGLRLGSRSRTQRVKRRKRSLQIVRWTQV